MGEFTLGQAIRGERVNRVNAAMLERWGRGVMDLEAQLAAFQATFDKERQEFNAIWNSNQEQLAALQDESQVLRERVEALAGALARILDRSLRIADGRVDCTAYSHADYIMQVCNALPDDAKASVAALRRVEETAPWWRRMSREDIAAELSATFDLGLDITRRIADWILLAALAAGKEERHE